jgi:hypothetical protein
VPGHRWALFLFASVVRFHSCNDDNAASVPLTNGRSRRSCYTRRVITVVLVILVVEVRKPFIVLMRGFRFFVLRRTSKSYTLAGLLLR